MMGGMDFLRSPMFGLVISPFVKIAVDFLKSKSSTLDSARPEVKQAVAVGVAAIGVLGTYVATGLSPDVGSALQSMFSDPVAASIALGAVGAVATKSGEIAAAAKTQASTPIIVPATSAEAEAVH